MREMPLTEGRSVDDEVEWLDEDRVLYALPEDAGEATGLDIEVLPVDGSAPPRLVLAHAVSAAVVRS